MKRIEKVLLRRREPDEVATPDIAIQNHCCECMGFQRNLVDGCTAPACWLFPHRNGFQAKTTPTSEKRA